MKTIFKINSNMNDVFLANDVSRGVFNFIDHEKITHDYDLDTYVMSIEVEPVDWRVFSKLETLHKLLSRLELLKEEEEEPATNNGDTSDEFQYPTASEEKDNE